MAKHSSTESRPLLPITEREQIRAYLEGGILNTKAIARIILLVSAIVCTFPAWAQITTGTITGTARDATGAVIPGAVVTIQNDATGEQRSATTNRAGEYAFPALDPGHYDIKFTSGSFAPLIEHATLNVTDHIAVDAVLQVSSAHQQVTVTGEQTLLQTQENTLGRVVDGTAIKQLPLATRNFTQILSLSPGTTSALNDATALGRGTQEISANGARTGSNAYYIDGIDAVNIHTDQAANNSDASNGVVTPSPEAIQEFKVQTGLYDALAGRSGGANVELVTRSGTNRFHGTVFEFFRNDALNANLFFFNQVGTPRPELRQNEFGGTLGGPVIKDKLLFFFSYQGTRQINGVEGSSTLDLPAIPTTRTDQTLGEAFAGMATYKGGTRVAANGSNINPVALALLNLKNPNGSYVIPSPQTAVTGGVNYAVSIPSTYNENQYIDGVDYQISAKNHISFKSIYGLEPQFNSFITGNVPGFGQTQYFSSGLYSLTDTHIFSPNLVNQARMGVSRLGGKLGFQNLIPISSIGMTRFNSALYSDIPEIELSGSFVIGYDTSGDQAGVDTTWQYFDDLSWTHGKHQIQTGGEFRRYQDNYYSNVAFRGELQIHTLPDFLLGLNGNSTASGGNGSGYSNLYTSEVGSGNEHRDDRISDYAFYGQDSWRVLSNLTINMGLRWEYIGLPVDRYGRNGAFQPSRYVPAAPGTFSSAGFVQMSNAVKPVPGIPKYFNTLTSTVSKLNFGPRIGFTYQPNRWLNARAGYGITVDRYSNQLGLREGSGPPNYESIDLAGTANVNATFQNPFPTLPLPAQFPITPQLYGGPYTNANPALSIITIDQNFRTPYIQQYGLDLQMQAAENTLVDIGYVGSRGLRLPAETELNQAIIATPANPVNGVTTTTNASANVQSRVPYIGFSPTGLAYLQSKASSTYSSLQASVTQRLSHGLQMLAAYTYSKSMDTTSGNTDGSTFNTYDGNQTNIAGNYGLSDFDRTHRVVVSGVYSAPAFGFGLDNTALGKKLFSGWQISGVGVAQSAYPIDVTDSSGGAYYGASTSRASFAPGATATTAKLSGRTENRLKEFFNTNAFVPAGNVFGDVGRNILRGPFQRNIDLAVIKNIDIHNGLNLEFRSEFFNILNFANFNLPGSAISSSSSFGIISSTVGNPRIIQFALKLSF